MIALLSFAAIAACTSTPLDDVEVENYDLDDEDVLRIMESQETDDDDDDDLEDFAELMSIVSHHSADQNKQHKSLTQKHESKQAQGKDDVAEENNGIFMKEDKELDAQGGGMNRLKRKLKKLKKKIKVLKKKLKKMRMRCRG